MTRNAELLRQVGDHIAENPDSYSQSSWLAPADTLCGTVGCVAGHAFRIGYEGEHYENMGAFVYWQGGQIFLDQEATVLLGLEDYDAQVLFHPDWEPAETAGSLGERVRDALYGLADGKPIEDVSANAPDPEGIPF